MKQTSKTIMGGRVEIIGPEKFVAAAAAKIESRFSVATEKPFRPAPVKSKWRAIKSSHAPQVSTHAFSKLSALDETLIGTPHYMGIAYFWNHEFRHYLRDASEKQRCLVHDLFLAAGLATDGATEEHWNIVRHVTKRK